MLSALYAAASFVSAFLLFQVQPMLGKRLLPWFGGSPATWTTCMLFFQVALLAGYALADRAIRGSRGAAQLIAALALPIAGLAFLPLGPVGADRPAVIGAQPVLAILALLARHAGVPYLALASASPLLQHWHERSGAGSPYGLYAWSNAGSLIGLLAYPFVIEPRLALDAQAWMWSVGFVGFVGLFATAAWKGTRTTTSTTMTTTTSTTTSMTTVGAVADWPTWMGLACVPSALLLAVTNYITVDVAVVPFLWVLPLALYLLSFIAAFAGSRVASRGWLLPAWIACTAALGVSLFKQGSAPLAQQVGVPLASLFVCALLCHGELARSAPQPERLSSFYLAIAAGGALGGLFVAGIAPLLFSGFYELQIATIATHVLLLVLVLRDPDSPRRRSQLRACWLGLGLGVPLVLATIWVQSLDRSRTGTVIEQRRSFHGVLRVTEWPEAIVLSHGRIRHGMEFRDPARRAQPTMYFGPDSGIGRALRLHAQGRARNVGVLGLGVGTLAAYGQPGDRFTFYELSPDVADVAQRRFAFLRSSRAHTSIVVGDGRLALERVPDHDFDVLVLDAFASDSVPAHLLTVEAFETYLRVLRPDGVLAANVSNRHVAVERVIAGAAARYGLALRLRESPHDDAQGFARARWALLARDRRLLDPLIDPHDAFPLAATAVTWRDDYSDLLSVLR